MVKILIAEQRISAWFANHVLCADHAQKEYLQLQCRIPERKLLVVLNLPNEQTFRTAARPRTDSMFRLVYHGTIARRLGIDILLRAVARAAPDAPVHLSIFGAGDFLDEALEVADELKLAGKVYFNKSFFPVEKIAEMVGGMDVGVIGNRRTLACDQFMLPVKLLEYVYLGLPVVAPRLQIIQRYFDESMIKYYEPEDDRDMARCIVELYRSPEERKQLVRNARTFYDRHNWRSQADAYLRLIPGLTGLSEARLNGRT
jgi:glycosyltransferase involved in cell wall biosynthesis